MHAMWPAFVSHTHTLLLHCMHEVKLSFLVGTTHPKY